ncbi:hypothetical protein ROG8370_00014 [Roseovarius gaetbuli]|uniref:Uncharacterized protein n=1 Tax=Roseovarius gaetbuli TaxID=1356575 RepID=A0A1X6Y3C3_9RHOB|nr:hypothetical protein ROG8370_00014 [Roseovarius gaetbuli]
MMHSLPPRLSAAQGAVGRCAAARMARLDSARRGFGAKGSAS